MNLPLIATEASSTQGWDGCFRLSALGRPIDAEHENRVYQNAAIDHTILDADARYSRDSSNDAPSTADEEVVTAELFRCRLGCTPWDLFVHGSQDLIGLSIP